MERLKLVVDRDSVCMADDAHVPHEREFDFVGDFPLSRVLYTIVDRHRFLPRIAGGRATWIVEGTHPLAVVAQQWPSPAFLVEPDTPISECLGKDAGKSLRFRYHCQVDPHIVLECLRNGSPLPER